MAITRITYNAAGPIGKLIAEGIDKVLVGRDILTRVSGVLLTMNDGSDWSALEAELSVLTGKGSSFNNLIVNATTALAVSDIEKLKRIYQG